jgi:hypothetical protein
MTITPRVFLTVIVLVVAYAIHYLAVTSMIELLILGALVIGALWVVWALPTHRPR